MKITILTRAMAALAILPGTASLEAAPSTPSATPLIRERPANPLPFSGRIYAVDAVAKTFSTQNPEKKIRVYVIGAGTKLTKKNSPAEFGDLKIGEEVRGMAVPKGNGQFDVTSLVIGPRDFPKPSPSAAPIRTAPPAPRPSPSKPGKKSPTPARGRPPD